MLRKRFKCNLDSSKELFIIAFILMNSLSWYFIVRRQFYATLEEFNTTPIQNLTIVGFHELALISSSVIGAWLSAMIRRFMILYLWMILGIASSFLICFLPYLSLAFVQIISIFWGVSFGLGMPSCLAFFGELTTFENRGYVGGLIFSIASATTPLLLVTLNTSFELSASTSVVWRVIGFVVLALSKPKETFAEKPRQTSFKLVFSDRQFLLYFIPWFMFSCVYGFQKVTLEHAVEADFYETLRVIQASFGAVSAFISGLVCGRFGRKRVVIYGFVSLGIAYAIVSIAPTLLASLLLSR